MGSQVAVITGGAQGIGKQTAHVLNDLGWSLVLLDLQEVDVTIYNDAMSLVGDITSEAFVQSALDATMKRFGRVDALVNNAGISCISAALDTPADLYRKVIDVNLVAPFLLAKAFGKVMIDAGSGAVVNVASVAGMQGVADRSAYNASKHGLIGLTRTLAVEWAPQRIRVNAIAPGPIPTDGVRKAFTPPADSGVPDVFAAADARMAEYAKKGIPLGRWGSPRDIANMVAFLASPAGDWITGSIFVIDGGEWLAKAPS